MLSRVNYITVGAMKVLMSSTAKSETKFYLVEWVGHLLNNNQHALRQRYGQQITGAVVV